jgi:hypothetical protein
MKASKVKKEKRRPDESKERRLPWIYLRLKGLYIWISILHSGQVVQVVMR